MISAGGLEPKANSVLTEALVAKKLQPVRVGFAVQQFAWALANAFGPVASKVSTVIEEKPQQVEIFVANMPAQEKVVPQAAVEVLYYRTSTRRFGHDLLNDPFKGIKPFPQFLSQLGFPLPVGRILLVHTL